MATLKVDGPAEQTTIPTRAASGYKQRLVLQVLWHPASKQNGDMPAGSTLAEYLYSLLTRDIDEPLAGDRHPGLLPIDSRAGKNVPEAFELDDAHHTVVVILIDAKLVNDDDWGKYVAEIYQRVQASNRRHRVIPVALCPAH